MSASALLRFVALVLLAAVPTAAQPADSTDAALQRSVDELRQSIGEWDVTTSFLAPDGSVAREVTGSYAFEWIVPDRVVAGRTEIPELQQTAGILFYIREADRVIEMVSVGADGVLWVMTGPLGGDTRMTPDVEMGGGQTGRLRFTRSDVTDDGFESRMAFSTDRGVSWLPANHQVFRRRPAE